MRQLAKAMKGLLSLPVMLSSKIGDPIVANDILKKGQADFIGLGRALLAEPEWPNKVAEGRLDDIRPCIRDMDGCINRVIKYRRIGCTANAQCGQEKNFKIEPSNHPIKVIVVGGGVAGMEAARVAALRGHKVTLFEKSDFLGGQARLAGLIPHKGDITLLIRYLEK